jgi:uncharacterized protein (TIGR03790 family)
MLKRNRTVSTYALASVTALFLCASAHALDPSEVLVLYNEDSPDGLEIANYYAQVYPEVQLLALQGVSTAEEISQDEYLNVIRPQVLAGLNQATSVIVTTKGLPLRINNTAPNPGTYPGWRGEPFGIPILDDWWEPYSSLESELTRVDLINSAEMMGDQAEFLSPPTFAYDTKHQAANPYFNTPLAFERKDSGIEGMRLTSRLDGFTVDDVKGMIDRAQLAFSIPSQQIVIADNDPLAPAAGVDRIEELAFNVLQPQGQNFIYDNTTADIVDSPWPVIGYVSHGSHAAGTGYIDNFQFDIANGAVFQTWESFNAYSFQEGNNKAGQGLVGEWIAAGGTAALGHVEEPGASAATVANEDIFWDMLLQGFTFAEAAWAATPQLSYVNTVIGDPLMTLQPWQPGDADLDGIVSVGDLSILLTNWNSNATGGAVAGDFNLDGYVGLDDLNILLGNWEYSPTPPATASVPEPASAAIILLASTLHMASRRARPMRESGPSRV